MADKNEKKYVIDNAQLMAEWDWVKNNELGLDPNLITHCSNKKAWWKCQLGHSWQDTASNRTQRNTGCPYCSGHRVAVGFNDFATVYPHLAYEWNFEKNAPLTPQEVSFGSGKKVWWKCSQGHEWQASINNRIKSGCPFCAGKRAISGVNDLQTLNPALAEEWHYDKNGSLKPWDVLPNSGKIVWWKCEKGHEWQVSVNNRSRGHGCPYCARRIATSGENDLGTVYPHVAKEWCYAKNGNLTPSDVLPGSEKKVWWKCEKGHEWQATINSRVSGNKCPICSSELRTSFPEYALLYYLKRCGLDTIHSYKELGYELDVFIPPLKVAIEYDGYFWHKNKSKQDLFKNLKCKTDGIKLYRIREGLPSLNDWSIDYEYSGRRDDFANVLRKIIRNITTIDVNIDIDRDAAEINNLRVLMEKENSISVTNPKLIEEWNYEKNGKLIPAYVTIGSNKKVWWKCSKGHEWVDTVSHRTKGRGCPYCSGKKVLQGETDLKTLSPVLATEWNYEKNGELTPQQVTINSNKKVWWKCVQGHEWQAMVSQRTRGSGCPYCAGQRVIFNKNDLYTQNPQLASEWNYAKNNTLTPKDVCYKSGKKVWWKCAQGHEWVAKIQNRANGRGCPYCGHKIVIPGENDFATLNPQVAAEWNYAKNNGMVPSSFLPNSNKKVWWKCQHGHEWQAMVADRNKGRGCPICRKNKNDS